MKKNGRVIEDIKIRVAFFDKDCHEDIVKKFDCGKKAINDCLREADKIEATTMLFFNDSNEDLIGYCSYCCSSIRIHEGEFAECYPAMEIKLYGISEEYQGCKILLQNNKQQSLSVFVFRYILNRLKTISQKHIFANYIILYALPDVVGFYEKNQFECITKDQEVLKGYFSEGCCPMYLPI